ncbi:hypothetical protein MSAS_27500 [Mycobacterium saskatchewanense]|uniref:Transmembrane protein n=1 Tax=Mycobacterium saskatchewanense TaxID=220927 RepID=A0A1X2C6S7_9MYCO|nr:hypothetical protein [Mycobacterium saskatchewanense]ORW71638.1 hypothetical protein AWC23_12730 [Mycobacterium saskatchewanense]BBX63576.1 hypothetical protein MSAS_27500 [Mycobacterium saskatchewanense]
MTSRISRYLPYSTRPGRLLVQLLSDFIVVVWTALWLVVGAAVHDAIATIAEAGRQVESGAHGIAGNLESAGHGAQHIPLLGDAVSKPLTSASQSALDIAGAGHSLDTTASWLAVLLAMAVASPPILVVTAPWLFLRLRFFRRKWTVSALAATAAGEQLLALRALTNRSPRKLTAAIADPVGGWRRDDPLTIRALALLELRAAGIRLRAG